MKNYVLALDKTIDNQPNNHYGHKTQIPNVRLYHEIDKEVFKGYNDLRDSVIVFNDIVIQDDTGDITVKQFNPCDTIENIKNITLNDNDCIIFTVEECRIMNGCLKGESTEV